MGRDQHVGPIFMAGADRSGIGLLTDVLNTHPSIHLSRRTRFWSLYPDGFGEIRGAADLHRVVEAMEQHPRMAELRPDAERLELELAGRGGPVPWGTLLATIHRHHLERTGASRWGDKSLDAELHAERIFRELPDAVMIHVVRDPRDRYVSHAVHRGRTRGGIGAGTALWLRSAALAARHAARHPDRYHVVRYEDLVSQPRATLQRICELVDVPFDPVMLTSFPMPPSHRRPAGAPAADHAFTTTSVGRYRTELPRRHVAFVDLMARRRMADLGYPPSGVQLTGPERARFLALDVPLGVGTMLVWRLTDRVRRSGPQAVRRWLRSHRR